MKILTILSAAALTASVSTAMADAPLTRDMTPIPAHQWLQQAALKSNAASVIVDPGFQVAVNIPALLELPLLDGDRIMADIKAGSEAAMAYRNQVISTAKSPEF